MKFFLKVHSYVSLIFALNGDLCLQFLYLFQKIKLFIQEEFHPIVLDRQAKSEGGLYTKFSLYWSKKLRSRYSSIVKKVKGKFGLVKVRQSRNGFFKPTILPKNEQTNSVFLPNSTKNEFVHSFFGRIRGYQKIIWPLLCKIA